MLMCPGEGVATRCRGSTLARMYGYAGTVAMSRCIAAPNADRRARGSGHAPPGGDEQRASRGYSAGGQDGTGKTLIHIQQNAPVVEQRLAGQL